MSTTAGVPVPASSAACTCSNKDEETCGCQQASQCKCAPGTCKCANCPDHGNATACGGKDGCSCKAGECDCADCPKSNKNKEKTVCNCGGDEGVCTCKPGECACANCAM